MSRSQIATFAIVPENFKIYKCHISYTTTIQSIPRIDPSPIPLNVTHHLCLSLWPTLSISTYHCDPTSIHLIVSYNNSYWPTTNTSQSDQPSIPLAVTHHQYLSLWPIIDTTHCSLWRRSCDVTNMHNTSFHKVNKRYYWQWNEKKCNLWSILLANQHI